MSELKSAEQDPTTMEDRELLLYEIAQAVEADEISELVWQALIRAYLGREGWRDAAEALFVKHGYSVEEIVRENGGLEDRGESE